ncbi:glycosyltransferase [Halobacillus mangrovi]|uniref:glycosyltransferase n=1 Tax=Halobacillus mangrovi TaxID=402384 RepID=UPI003D97DD71
MFWLLFILSIFWFIILLDFIRGFRKITSIENVLPERSSEVISVILAAKDEEASIQQTIESLVNQKQVELEIIAVNDRSNDDTGTILQKLSNKYNQMNCIHIESLPEGWLGKTHALWQGAKITSGNYLLFTGADIHFSPDIISKAITYMKKEKADHLTAAPNLEAQSVPLKGLISFFLFGFGYLKRPWTANNTKNKGGMGIGAFQLMTRECYQSVGGHYSIRLRPDDDLALGMRVKKSGYNQRLVTALKSLSVEWYPSLAAALRGFEKNAFAGLNYSILRALTAMAGVIISQVLPFLFLFSSFPKVQIISAVNVILLFYLYALTTKYLTTYSRWIIVGLPFFILLFIYMLGRALILTWVRGGIMWRGSHYSLKELKQNFKDTEED